MEVAGADVVADANPIADAKAVQGIGEASGLDGHDTVANGVVEEVELAVEFAGGLDEFVEFRPRRRLSSSRSAATFWLATTSVARSSARRSSSWRCRLHVASRNRASASVLDLLEVGVAATLAATDRESYRLRPDPPMANSGVREEGDAT